MDLGEESLAFVSVCAPHDRIGVLRRCTVVDCEMTPLTSPCDDDSSTRTGVDFFHIVGTSDGPWTRSTHNALWSTPGSQFGVIVVL